MIHSIKIHNGETFELGGIFKLFHKNCRTYTVSEIKDVSIIKNESVHSEFHVMVETEDKTTILYKRIINCPVVVNEIY